MCKAQQQALESADVWLTDVSLTVAFCKFWDASSIMVIDSLHTSNVCCHPSYMYINVAFAKE